MQVFTATFKTMNALDPPILKITFIKLTFSN